MAENLSIKKEEGRFFIDLESFGYTKLIGTGSTTKSLMVKASSCSKSTAEKIEEAGGQILIEHEEWGVTDNPWLVDF